jgi:LPS sulfotransferase NodH
VDNYEKIVKDIFDYLKIPIPDRLGTSRRKLEKMADSLSEEWVRRYREIKEAG